MGPDLHAPSMTIGGRPHRGNGSFEVVDPATEAVIGHAPSCSRQLLDAAMDAARAAQRDWALDDEARREALRASADVLLDRCDELAQLLTAEQGKPQAEAVEEVEGAAAWFRYFAGLEWPRTVIRDDERAFIEVVPRPLGVVAAITPWNFPLLLSCWKIAPALRAGNTVVVKPSPFTPLSTLRMAELLNEVLPAGVLSAVSGGDELGAWMTAHPIPRKISFTGSVDTGRRVMRAAADDLKRLTLELGGNDAAILLDDVDLERAAESLFWGAFLNAGQVCSAIKRVYAPASRYEEVVDALAGIASGVRVGPGSEPDVAIGPINNLPQRDRVLGLIADAVDRGATVAAGGSALKRPGWFVAPTILAEAKEGMAVVDEEQFGPVLPVLRYEGEDEAVRRANATEFGLSGSVWSSDPERAAQRAEQLECGTVWVNDHLALAPYQPFGGHKHSGLGVENGPWGLDSFSELQVLHRRR